MRNSATSYGLPSKILHWLMAVLIVGLFAVGLYMADLEMSPDKLKIYGLHKSIGITVLALVIVRLVWRLSNPVPESAPGLSKLENSAATAAHYALYALIFLIPISGWLMSSYAGFPVSVFGLFTLPPLAAPDKAMVDEIKEWHESLAWMVILLAAAHAGAALYHHFIRKDNVLRRMWF